MCPQSVGLAGICTAAVCGTAGPAARFGSRKYRRRRDVGVFSESTFFGSAQPVRALDDSELRQCELDTRPAAALNQGRQVARYELDEIEAFHYAPKCGY